QSCNRHVGSTFVKVAVDRREEPGIFGTEEHSPEQIVQFESRTATQPTRDSRQGSQIVVDQVVFCNSQHAGVGVRLVGVGSLAERAVFNFSGGAQLLVHQVAGERN